MQDLLLLALLFFVFTRIEFQREVEAKKKTMLGSFASPPLSIAHGSSSDPATPVAMKDSSPPAETATRTAPTAAVRLPQIKPYVRKRPTKGFRSCPSGQPVGSTSGRTEAADTSNQIKHNPLTLSDQIMAPHSLFLKPSN